MDSSTFSLSDAPVPSDASSARAPASSPSADDAPRKPLHLLEADVIEALKEVFDPELPVNIYDLGLVYGIEITEDGSAHVRMTLTAPACPAAQTLPGEIEAKVRSVEGISAATVEVVWDPPYHRSMMSEDARLELGLW